MKLALPRLASLRRLPALSLTAVLAVSWWAVFGFLLVVLVLDGLLFYQYGLGRAEPVVGPGGPVGVVRFREEAVRAAAAKLEERRRRFETATSTSEALPNPFR